MSRKIGHQLGSRIHLELVIVSNNAVVVVAVLNLVVGWLNLSWAIGAIQKLRHDVIFGDMSPS